MKHIPIILIALALSGCATSSGTGERIAFDALSTGIGGAAAYYGGNGDPALTTAGAVGGFVVSEAFQAIARSGRQKAYQSGIMEGKTMGQEEVLKGLWEESNGLPKRSLSQPLSRKIDVPARIQNGVRYDAHSIEKEVPQPERILVPGNSQTNRLSNAHYQIFQTEK